MYVHCTCFLSHTQNRCVYVMTTQCLYWAWQKNVVIFLVKINMTQTLKVKKNAIYYDKTQHAQTFRLSLVFQHLNRSVRTGHQNNNKTAVSELDTKTTLKQQCQNWTPKQHLNSSVRTGHQNNNKTAVSELDTKTTLKQQCQNWTTKQQQNSST